MDSPSEPQRGQTAGLPRRRVRGLWYRMVARRYRAEIDSDAGALLVGGRYNPAGEFGALYLAESEDACRAEVARRIEPDTTLSFGTLEIDLDAGFEGLIAPSAAGPYVTLVVFKDRIHPSSSIRVVSVTDL